VDKRIVIPGAALASAAALLGAACGGADERSSAASNPPSPTCPAAWRSGWQRLADRVRFRVYCPGWIPSPLNARIDGRFSSGVSVGKDRSYLAGFIWFERGSGEVHVNFRGYPNRRSIPTCVGGEQVPRKIPCFTDRRGTKRIGAARVTLYTVNRDADQWHLLYLWRRAGSLYTLSEHVAPPYSYKRVLKNLDRMMRNLVLIEPSR
jgi:hypothetical protein